MTYKPTGAVVGITPLTTTSGTDSEWYAVDGRKLQKAPTQKGLFIVNGKKVVVK